MSNSSIKGRIIGMQQRLDNEIRNTPRDHLANNSQGGFGAQNVSASRPGRPNNLNFKVPVQSPHVVETENRMKEVHKISGKLNIGGQEYRSRIEDLQTLGDLGSGTCGHVVKMLHKPSAAVIAVKQMRRSGNSDENKRILMDLDVVVKSLDCPYIVQCYGCFYTDTDVWICMELMATCFDKLLKRLRAPIPEEILGKVTVATVKALSYLKDEQEIIHRDVKPSNILLDERGNIKLCDFGISGRLVDSKAKTRTAGCAAYLAPERIEPPDPKRPAYDIRADVWSLGISLVELATGMFPYRNCKHDIELLSRVVNEEPPQLPADSDFSHEFKAFVSQCLTKNYKERPKYVKLLKHPFVIKSEQSKVSVGDWYASLPTSTESTPSKPGLVTTTATFTINATSNGQHVMNKPASSPAKEYNFLREDSIPNIQDRIERNFVISSRENSIPNNIYISSRRDHMPSYRDNNYIVGLRENYIPSNRENNYVTSLRDNNYVQSSNNYVQSSNNYVQGTNNHVQSSRDNYVQVSPREDKVGFVPREDHRINYVTSHNGQRDEPRNFVKSSHYYSPDQVTPTPQRPWWATPSVGLAGGSSSQPASLDTDYDSLSPYPRRRTIEGGSSPPPLPARRVSLDRRMASPASSGNTSPIVLQRFHHQCQQRRSRVDLNSTPRHRSLSREHSNGRSPEPPPRISRQRHIAGHNVSDNSEPEPPPLHERLHAPRPLLYNKERQFEGRSHSMTRAELLNGYTADPQPPAPPSKQAEEQSWLQSLAGLVKRRLSGYVKHPPPSLQRRRLLTPPRAPAVSRCGESECWSLPGSPRPPRAPRPAD